MREYAIHLVFGLLRLRCADQNVCGRRTPVPNTDLVHHHTRIGRAYSMSLANAATFNALHRHHFRKRFIRFVISGPSIMNCRVSSAGPGPPLLLPRAALLPSSRPVRYNACALAP
jgi:hypothetical protein